VAAPDLSKLKIDRSKLNPQAGGSGSYQPIFIGAGLLLVGVLIYLGFRSSGSERDESSTVSAQSEKRVEGQSGENSGTVQTKAPSASRTAGAGILHATGYVVAQRKAAVSSKATGRLKELSVVEGDRVKAGQVLGVIENEDLLKLVAEREANISALEARIRFAEAEFENAKTDRQRQEKLFNQKVASAKEFEDAQSRYRKAQAELESSRASLELGKAQLAAAKVDLDYTYIVAPFDGTVLTKDADVGEMVTSMGAATNAKAAIVTIADMSSLEVEADVSEANISKVSVGQECEITLDSYPGKIYQGVVSRIVPTVDRAKATVMVKIKFKDLDQFVLPEMSAKVALQLK
jgi:RND family efflux transporter MFP subunit